MDMKAEEGLRAKREALERDLAGSDSILVAFSGGADSAFLLAVAKDAMKGTVLAVTASSPLYPRSFIERASRIAASLGVEHIVIDTAELEDARFVANPPERCYLCKRELYAELLGIADGRGISRVVDGTQADDTGDYRPGMEAARELGVESPLLDAGYTKDDVRAQSRELGLETWDIPAGPCLASRVPYGDEITPGKLEAIEKGEAYLASLGFREVRVRYSGKRTARIEIERSEIARLLGHQLRAGIVERMKELGFLYVTLDLEGFRSGSMNEVLA
ncbi:MAG: ATP-dependent sacrificial sulfur transferase LarE [Candidatus Geothermincolia bacterium]